MSEQIQRIAKAGQLYIDLVKSLSAYFEGYGYVPSYFDGYAIHISPIQMKKHLETEEDHLLVVYKLAVLTQKVTRYFLGQDEYDPSILEGKKFAYPGARMVFGEKIIEAQNLYTGYAQCLAESRGLPLSPSPYKAWVFLLGEIALDEPPKAV